MKACLQEAAQLSGWKERLNKTRSACTSPASRLGHGFYLVQHRHGAQHPRSRHCHARCDLRTARSSCTPVLPTWDRVPTLPWLRWQLKRSVSNSRQSRSSDLILTSTFDAGPSVASRQTFISGNAVLNAAQPIREVLLQTASEITGLPVEILQLRDGLVLAEGERLSLTVAELAVKATQENRCLHADGFYAMEYPEPLPPNSYRYAPSVFTFGTQVAQVLVDIETGQVTIEKLVAVQDAGQVINPGGARGQIEGGVIMGLGYALMEELLVDQGSTQNPNLGTYLIPTAKDVPALIVKIVEIPEPYAPFGAKGLGEPPLTPTAPAILNAVVDAIGVPLYQIPLTPERVLTAIESAPEKFPKNGS